MLTLRLTALCLVLTVALQMFLIRVSPARLKHSFIHLFSCVYLMLNRGYINKSPFLSITLCIVIKVYSSCRFIS